jgi:(2Fe-2S) ferredoxin
VAVGGGQLRGQADVETVPGAAVPQPAGLAVVAAGAQAGFDRCKARVKAAGAAGAGQVRVNRAGCLDRCAGGPVAVVYPEAVWYTYVDERDIDEIVDSHLLGGVPVERLRLPPEVGR